ncbi:MAG: hypothetical protein ABI548_04935 [Polyangiaceae bacterium]
MGLNERMNVDTQTAAAPDATVVDSPLYSPGQVALATFLGSPIAGCWLLAANYAVLGERDARRRTLVYGAIATVVVLAIAFVLPEHVPNVVLPAAYTATLREIANRRQGKLFNAHIQRGGRKHSNWRVAGIGLAWLAAVLVAVVIVLLVLPG